MPTIERPSEFKVYRVLEEFNAIPAGTLLRFIYNDTFTGIHAEMFEPKEIGEFHHLNGCQL